MNQGRILPVISGQTTEYREWEDACQGPKESLLTNNMIMHKLTGNKDWSAFSNQKQTLAQKTNQGNWAGDQINVASPTYWTDSGKVANSPSNPSSCLSEDHVMNNHVINNGNTLTKLASTLSGKEGMDVQTKQDENIKHNAISIQDLKEDAQLLIKIISQSTGLAIHDMHTGLYNIK